MENGGRRSFPYSIFISAATWVPKIAWHARDPPRRVKNELKSSNEVCTVMLAERMMCFQFGAGGGKDLSDVENMDHNAGSGKYFSKDLLDPCPTQFVQSTTDIPAESDLCQLQFNEEMF